jgi:hypothetical protein
MSPESKRIRGEDARALLENKLLKGAFSAVDEFLNNAALSCAPDDKDKAQRIILSKQLLAAIQREIRRAVEDGEIAKVQLAEIEQRKGLKKFFR